MRRNVSPFGRLPLAIAVCLLALASCAPAERASEPESTTSEQAPATGPIGGSPETIVMAMTFFDADQAATVSKDWTRARNGMAALGGYRYAALFTSMDWERTSTLMGMSLWDDAQSAGRGLKVAEAQVPARAWARTGTYRRAVHDGDMRDSVFQSIVMVLPIPAAVDSAKAETSFAAANAYMKTQPGYMASVLYRRVAGDPTFGHVIAARWATRENLQAAARSKGFNDLRPTLEFGSGQATTYLQLMY